MDLHGLKVAPDQPVPWGLAPVPASREGGVQGNEAVSADARWSPGKGTCRAHLRRGLGGGPEEERSGLGEAVGRAKVKPTVEMPPALAVSPAGPTLPQTTSEMVSWVFLFGRRAGTGAIC